MLWTPRAQCAPSSRRQRPCRPAAHYQSAVPQASVLLVARTTVRPASCHLRTTALWSCVAGRPPQSRPAEIYVWLFAPLLLEAIYRYALEQTTFLIMAS